MCRVGKGEVGLLYNIGKLLLLLKPLELILQFLSRGDDLFPKQLIG